VPWPRTKTPTVFDKDPKLCHYHAHLRHLPPPSNSLLTCRGPTEDLALPPSYRNCAVRHLIKPECTNHHNYIYTKSAAFTSRKICGYARKKIAPDLVHRIVWTHNFFAYKALQALTDESLCQTAATVLTLPMRFLSGSQPVSVQQNVILLDGNANVICVEWL